MISEDVFLPGTEQSFRRRVLLALQKAVYWSGVGYLYLKIRRQQGAIILTYHSVAPAASAYWIDPRNRISPGLFERQMRFLAEHRRVISTNALLKALMERSPLPAGSVVLTFDDGYRDNLGIAAPVLRHYGLHALLYVPTGLMTRGESPWADDLYTLFRTRTKHTLRLPDDGTAIHDLRDPRASRTAYAQVSRALVTADRLRRDALLRSVVDQLAPSENTPRLTVSWDELRALQSRFPLFDLGVHSANHIDYTSVEKNIVREDLRECAADFYRELGTPAVHFAYPYDRRSDNTDGWVAAAGLRSAVGSGSDCLVSTSCDPHKLQRLDTPRSMSLFRFWTSGAYPGLPRTLIGRA